MTADTTNRGAALKAARERKLMTLRELADAVNAEGQDVHFTHLGRLERGEFSPRPKLRAALAKVLNINTDQIG